MACILVREQEAKKIKKSTVTGSVSEKAYIFHAIDSPVSKSMRVGYLRLLEGYVKEFESTVDEVNLLLEGSLTYTCEGKSFTAKKGDIAFIERGSRVHFSTKEGCFVFCVTYPILQGALNNSREHKKE